MRYPCHDIVFYVATVGQGIALQPSYACATETLCHDSVALCCVTIEKAMRAQQTKPGAYDKVGAPRLGANYRGIMS